MEKCKQIECPLKGGNIGDEVCYKPPCGFKFHQYGKIAGWDQEYVLVNYYDKSCSEPKEAHPDYLRLTGE